MLSAKTLADILTAGRAFLGLMLIYEGIIYRADGLAVAAITLLAAWITDILDGPIARRDTRGITSWIGEHDLEADLVVALGVWFFLGLAGFVSPFWVVIYLIIAILFMFITHSIYVGWLVQVVPYASMIVMALLFARPYGIVLVTYLLLILVVTWPLFINHKVPDFINGMRDVFKDINF